MASVTLRESEDRDRDAHRHSQQPEVLRRDVLLNISEVRLRRADAYQKARIDVVDVEVWELDFHAALTERLR